MSIADSRASLVVALGLSLAGAAGCSSSSSGGSAAASAPATYAVTADWLHHTLSVIDYDALVTKAKSGADARTEVDLSAYAQGPMTVKITPDGKTAIVSLSTGFFSVPGATILVNAPSLPTGPSKVIFVDVASKKVTGELDTGDGATGIAITHDGKTAFVCHVGTTKVSVIDVASRSMVSEFDLGGTFAEEVALDDSDTVGAVTYLDPSTNQKNVRTFAVADMGATLSDPIPLNTDAAGVPFFPGTKTVFVVLAYNPVTSPASGYALVDATDPHAPKKLAETTWTDSTYIAYQAIPAPARGTVLVPVADGNRLKVREYGLGSGDVTLKQTYDVAATQLFGAFGVVVDAAGRMVLTMPGERQLAVYDLGAGTSFTVPWFSEAGPTGIALHEAAKP
jgi:DNA-binding beta-propeller fold protein YncE